MPVMVQKYGGSSVATVAKIKQVAALIVAQKRRGYDVVVVVSAMGDTTDELLSLAREVSPSPARRELDMLLSCGERISMALLSMAIQDLGEQAISMTGSQSGIITNDNHFNAKIIEVRPYRIEDELARGAIVIVAGYQGMSYRREITTLGRGGSDTTAVALAAALSAEACEIYSDVDGVLSADPRVVSDAQPLKIISYEAMQAFAHAGAKVLNAEAVEYAKRARIKLYSRKTGLGEAHPGTLITQESAPVRRVLGVASKSTMWCLQAHITDMQAILNALSNAGLPIEHLSCALETHRMGERDHSALFSAILDGEKISDPTAIERIAQSHHGEVRSCAAVSLVGEEVGHNPALLAEAAAGLAHYWALFTTSHTVTAIVATAQAEATVKEWHTRFVTGS